PNEMIHMPWIMDADQLQRHGVTLGDNYPAPIIESEQAAREAKANYTAWRQRSETRELSKVVLHKHGSRKKQGRHSKGSKPVSKQKDLFV
ncbi:MAG: FAD-binding domain-containing protein, partial [Arenimonas sp.]